MTRRAHSSSYSSMSAMFSFLYGAIGTKIVLLGGTMTEHCDWFILPLLLPTPTIWFSLDHKLYASDYNSDSDSVASENKPLER